MQEFEAFGAHLPQFVPQESEEYLKCGLLIAGAVGPHLELELDSSLNRIQAASINYRIAIGPNAGRKALTLYSVPPVTTKRQSVDNHGRVVCR